MYSFIKIQIQANLNSLSDKPEITLKPMDLLSFRKLEIPRVEEAQVASLPLYRNCIGGFELNMPTT
ncbi:MAG: hypothetical protein B6D71_14490 [gamma proteobacterium symbiont of Stewartia floridana]|nr:MAG: hypothetical protein B6D71_14490 [gamma proteobacterium symbiont of Stewartia floridana]